MRRIAVVGTSGAGKSTLADTIAEKLNIPHIELDAIHWLPNWEMRELGDLRARVGAVTADDAWVISGNYGKVRDLVWSRADTLIWLDYPLRIVLPRLLKRTLNRMITQERLWESGNTEQWRNLISRDKETNILLWAIDSHPRHRRDYPALFEKPEYAHLHVIRFTHPHEADGWLKRL
jgi:adenylate kinase family enzyme